MAKLNDNFPFLRRQTKLSMKNIGIEIGKHHTDKKPIPVPSIQTYESSSTPSLDVIEAMINFFKEYDENFTSDHLLFKDLKAENYHLPMENIKSKLKANIQDEITIEKSMLEDLVQISIAHIKKLEEENQNLNSELYKYKNSIP